MADEDKLIVPHFKVITQKNEAKSKKEGRPIYDEMEVVEVRKAGDRLNISVFPAHAFHRWITTMNGDQEEQTYAQRWPEQYRRFKENRQQVAEGTPIDELPFLSASKRAELKALAIYTAEALAALDGQNLKTLGPAGRELKAQAQAYIDNASGTAVVTRMASEIESLKEQIKFLRSEKPATSERTAPGNFDGWDVDALKDWIEQATGERPRGNPNQATLVKRAEEILAQDEFVQSRQEAKVA